MTAIVATPSSQPPPEPRPLVPAPGQPGAAPAATPWLAQVMLDTVGRTGARAGLIWVLVVAFFAVAAPFLATSHPYFLRTNDPQLMNAMLPYMMGIKQPVHVVTTDAWSEQHVHWYDPYSGQELPRPAGGTPG